MMRRVTRAVSLSLACLAWTACGRDASAPEQIHTPAEDDRLLPLLAPCPFGRLFDGDTTNMIPVLVEKLRSGQVDPLRQAKRELGELGPAAVPELERLYDACSGEQWIHGVLINILDTCSLMDGPYGLGILRKGLEHSQESVRIASLDGLTRYGGPEDYDLLSDWLSVSRTSTVRGDYGLAMVQVDPERFLTDFVGWIDEQVNQDVLEFVFADVLSKAGREQAEAIFERREALSEKLRPFANALGAKFELEGALELLRADLGSESDVARGLGVRAAGMAGLGLEALPIFQHDVLSSLRLAAMQALLLDADERLDGWLLEGLADPSEDVRSGALIALVERGNERGVAEALALIGGSVRDRELGMRALRLGWEASPASVDAAYETLTRLFEQRDAAAAIEQISYLQALSLVPGRRTAQYLLDLGEHTNTMIRGLTAHRWCVIQVLNAGPQAYQLLRERLETSTDPFRQLDLIFGLWQERSAESRESLFALLDRPQVDAYVRLYAADRLTHMGPAGEVAPRLKRIYLASQEEVMRTGLQCLLWVWYGLTSP